MKTIYLWVRKSDETYFCYTPEFLAGQERTIDGEKFLLDSDANINRWFAHATPDAPAIKCGIHLVSPFLRRHNVAIQTAIQEFDMMTKQWKANQLRHDAVAVTVGVDSWDLTRFDAAFTPDESGVNAMPDELASAVTYVVVANLFGGSTDEAFLP